MARQFFSNPSTLSLGLVLVAAAACSSDSDHPMASSPPSANTPGAPAEMAGTPTTAGAAAPGAAPGAANPGSAQEGSPGNLDLVPASGAGNEPPPPGARAPNAAAAGEPVPSAGCNSNTAAASGRFTIDVAGTPRDYILALPGDYEPTRPYRLIFTWHPGGGTAQQTAGNYYGLQRLAANSTIFVSPEGIDNGWANTGGRDIAFLDGMLDRFEAELCIDQSRIFSTGFSYGGMMSFAIGCGRADVFRAIAPMSGALYSGCANGDTPIAMLGFHGTTDTVVPIANGRAARDTIAGRNDCQPAAMATAGDDGCLSFQGCSEGHSVTWCEFEGGHMPAPNSAQRIWDFFSSF
jgi:polyhydroxybutyrate depolymerase